MVYKTTVGGEAIEASGLVCVPSVSGNYPLLSFQNGTNTQNAFAPSDTRIIHIISLLKPLLPWVLLLSCRTIRDSEARHRFLTLTLSRNRLLSHPGYVPGCQGGWRDKDPECCPKNEYYLLGYSQGGWATLSLHNSMELDYPDEFNLSGSAEDAVQVHMIYTIFLWTLWILRATPCRLMWDI